VLSAGMLVLHDRVIPASHLAFRQQLKAIGIKSPTAYLEAGTFIKAFEPYIIFVYHVEGRKLFHIRIYEPQPAGPTRTTVANRGQFEPMADERGIRLTLYDGTVDEWNPEHPGSLVKGTFGTYSMALSTITEGKDQVGKKLKEMTFRELMQERQRITAEGIDPLPITLEFHRKVATAFSVVVFVTFGLAMGLGLHHQERLTIFVWVLGLTIAYYLASIGTNAIAIKAWMPAWLAMWLPNLVGGALGAWKLVHAVRR